MIRHTLRILYAVCGDLLASLFVGTALAVSYDKLARVPGLPELVGFIAPLVVYRFSTLWNRRTFAWRPALRLATLMGTVFVVVHHASVSWWLMTAPGYLAPIIVSAVARRQGRRRREHGKDCAPDVTRQVPPHTDLVL